MRAVKNYRTLEFAIRRHFLYRSNIFSHISFNICLTYKNIKMMVILYTFLLMSFHVSFGILLPLSQKALFTRKIYIFSQSFVKMCPSCVKQDETDPKIMSFLGDAILCPLLQIMSAVQDGSARMWATSNGSQMVTNDCALEINCKIER